MRFLILVLFINIAVSGSFKEESETIIKNFFGKDVRLKFEMLQLEKDLKKEVEWAVKQRFFRPEVHYWQIFKEDSLIGTAYLDNVSGRMHPITFIVIINTNYEVEYFDILKYRSPYGGGVLNDWWKDQFIGKSSDESFSVGEDIQAISGASISVKGLALGVKKLLILTKKLENDLK